MALLSPVSVLHSFGLEPGGRVAPEVERGRPWRQRELYCARTGYFRRPQPQTVEHIRMERCSACLTFWSQGGSKTNQSLEFSNGSWWWSHWSQLQKCLVIYLAKGTRNRNSLYTHLRTQATRRHRLWGSLCLTKEKGRKIREGNQREEREAVIDQSTYSKVSGQSKNRTYQKTNIKYSH